MHGGLKIVLDLGPAILFAVTFFALRPIMPGQPHEALPPAMKWATAAFVAATLASLGISYLIERKLHPVPLITAVIVMVFGGLAIVLHDQRFVEMKLTILYVIFAAALFGGLAFGRLFLRSVLGHALHLTDEGWRVLTVRFGLYFVAAAILNEIVWRNFSNTVWVAFKLGLIGVTFVFTVWQVMFVTRYQVKPEEAGEPRSE